ncbi:PucR family transcriptional regulator [Sphaerisporangium fuscum]|uniref:PucR family transcriptional regulator n=1 Tax=Sphaerisporangium fuscum TaxID=2835868 RepID=UPI001BDC1672|nr:helix-turn-helix domain-containing protein [Sphaerisporangium fuscum]
MTARPRASLRRILEDLGSTVLDVAASPGELDTEVTGVQIYDPLDELPVMEGDILLAVGVDSVERILALLETAGGAAGIVVKQPVAVDELVRAKVLETGVALLGLTRAASWAQVAALLRSLLAEDDLAEPGETPSDGLFSLANAVCALLDAPVTIEDRSSRVLAYSERQEEADAGRVETVLGRQVPERYRRMLVERGWLRRLYQSREPVYMELEGDSINRAAVAVRSGDEILGSIWAAVREPLSEQRQRALADAAKVVALQLLRQRAGSDTRRRLHADLLSTVLEGGKEAVEAAGRLGVASERLCVLAAQLVEEPYVDVARRESDRQRFCDALALHVGAIHPKAAAALVGSVAYAVLPLHSAEGDEEARAVRIAESFLTRVGPRHRANIGVGRLAADLTDVARSRTDADRALRVLRARGSAGEAAGYTAVHFEALLLQLSDLAKAEEQAPTGPYERLLAHDAEHDSHLVDTLRAYLDAFGDVKAASARIHVHTNTFRYRLKRLTEISGLDLDDPEARLAVMLQMRIFGS